MGSRSIPVMPRPIGESDFLSRGIRRGELSARVWLTGVLTGARITVAGLWDGVDAADEEGSSDILLRGLLKSGRWWREELLGEN